MKTAISLLLIIALGGASLWLDLKAKGAEARAVAAEEASTQAAADLVLSEQRRKQAEITVAQLEAQIAQLNESAQKAGTLTERMEQLRAIYDRNASELNAQKAALSANLAQAEAARQDLMRNQPSFSEQVTTTSGTSGVRTSRADREEAIELHQEKLEQAARKIADIEGEIVQVDGKFELLGVNYQAAQNKARIEFRSY